MGKYIFVEDVVTKSVFKYPSNQTLLPQLRKIKDAKIKLIGNYLNEIPILFPSKEIGIARLYIEKVLKYETEDDIVEDVLESRIVEEIADELETNEAYVRKVIYKKRKFSEKDFDFDLIEKYDLLNGKKLERIVTGLTKIRLKIELHPKYAKAGDVGYMYDAPGRKGENGIKIYVPRDRFNPFSKDGIEFFVSKNAVEIL